MVRQFFGVSTREQETSVRLSLSTRASVVCTQVGVLCYMRCTTTLRVCSHFGLVAQHVDHSYNRMSESDCHEVEILLYEDYLYHYLVYFRLYALSLLTENNALDDTEEETFMWI